MATNIVYPHDDVTGYFIVNRCNSLGYTLIQPMGYEHTGGKPKDGKEYITEEMFTAAVKALARTVAETAQAREMDHAIAALHGQHSTNGHPSRYLP